MGILKEKRESFIDVLKLDMWQKNQDSFAKFSGLGIKMLDFKGALISKPSDERDFCKLLQKSPQGFKNCQQFYSKSCAYIAKERKPFILRCYADLLSFAVPVAVNGDDVGVLMGGQVLVKSPQLDRYLKLITELELNPDEFIKSIGSLKIKNVKDLQTSADYIKNMSATMLSNIYLKNKFQVKMSQLLTLFNLSTDLSPDIDVHEVFALILNSISILFDVQTCSLMLLDKRDMIFKTQTAFGEDESSIKSYKCKANEGLVGEVMASHQVAKSDGVFQILKAGFPENITSVISFPLFFGEKVEGIINVFNTPLDEDEIKTISAFSNQAVMAIQNAQLRRVLKKRLVEISSFDKFSTDMKSAVNVDQLFEVILRELTKMVQAEQASLMILNEETEDLIVKMATGASSKIIKQFKIKKGDGLAGLVAETGQPILVRDIKSDTRIKQKKRSRYKTDSFVILPLKVNNRTVGVINIADKVTGEIFNEEDLKLLTSFATQASIAIERSELYEKTEKLKKVSITDYLTNLVNRRYFQRRLREEINRANRHQLPLSLMMIDVDDFKYYNDRHGHLAGDEVLKIIGQILLGTVRNIDVVARFGGEEFAVISPQTPKEEASILAERIRAEVHDFYFMHGDFQPQGRLTISVGLATYPEDAKDLENLINSADKALYKAKMNEKNKVIIFTKNAS